MNIAKAKEYIRQTVALYLTKNEFDEYEIPVLRQRPIFLVGAPGVGKTMIMEQVAQEMGIALVSYSMTHHTRQSALGLPFIKHAQYDGIDADITEYTMSEIIASIYETMKESGIKEGILFLDEINCVSETLTPSMLQFLQYKVFGRHSVPEGWVIVTAGNPVEYNKSVKEFDVVVLDRMKVINVEAEYKAFKDYALDNGIHPAIISFLDIKPDYFYKIENTVKGRSYVTARGWEDLSTMIKMYEASNYSVTSELIEQYLSIERVVKEFSAYYDLYNKYKREYHVEEILKGNVPDDVILRAKSAKFDERLSLMSMLCDIVIGKMREVILKTDFLTQMSPVVKSLCEKEGAISDDLFEICDRKRMQLTSQKRAGSLSKDNENIMRRSVKFLENARREVLDAHVESMRLKEVFNDEVMSVKSIQIEASDMLHEMFEFVSKSFADGNEMVALMAHLTTNSYSSRFIARFKSEDYLKYSDEMMLGERGDDLKKEVSDILKEFD